MPIGDYCEKPAATVRAAAQRNARAREFVRDVGKRVRDLGEQLEHLGVEAKDSLLRELDGLRERVPGRKR